ncbi:sensor histidine kinase [Aurantibacillus circumpalustris]|uniref:sensor histidine kinase n=1 Tax=Aurantibacillus circumpalustris TaxID=3036359 RepID=UPI00295A6358|nr:HAMP domain-containing sensor histidine kinase [Aurantibacillus circumpalustris]
MNIYAKKQRWKMALAAAALLIVLASFWYTNNLVERISRDEKLKAEVWAQAVQKRAKLIKVTNRIFNEIKSEERKKAELVAEAFKQLNQYDNSSDINFVLKVLQENTTVPVILVNDNGEITSRNLDSLKSQDTVYLRQELNLMKAKYEPVVINYYRKFNSYLYYNDSKVFTDLQLIFEDLIKSFKEVSVNTAEVQVIFTDASKRHVIEHSDKFDTAKINTPEKLRATLLELAQANQPIPIDLGQGETNYIFYAESDLLTKLKFYPYVQFGVIGLFLLIAYILFSTARKAEQDQVWVGMSKETAHQLGTPLSSLMAWNEHLLSQGVDEAIVNEMQQDVKRLNTITDRFSKIGSQPTLVLENVNEVLFEAIDYLKKRTSKNVAYTLNLPEERIQAHLSKPLFEWVIENLCKNAVDAMEGKGTLNITLTGIPEGLIIDITDSGKGIHKSKFTTVFEPGFTTKNRGWGLGLSLCKRIIEIYHKGKIYVLNSEPNKGTTFRIKLDRN